MATSFVDDLVTRTEETLAGLDDKDWTTVVRFFLPSLIEHRPNDLVRILWDRAYKRAKESNDFNLIREVQHIMEHLELAITRRI